MLVSAYVCMYMCIYIFSPNHYTKIKFVFFVLYFLCRKDISFVFPFILLEKSNFNYKADLIKLICIFIAYLS